MRSSPERWRNRLRARAPIPVAGWQAIATCAGAPSAVTDAIARQLPAVRRRQRAAGADAGAEPAVPRLAHAVPGTRGGTRVAGRHDHRASSCTSSPRRSDSPRCFSRCRSPTTRCAGRAPRISSWLAWDVGPVAAAAGCSHRARCRRRRRAKLFRMGLLTSILNPKVALFYLALFPQFVDPARGSVLAQSLVLGATQIVIAVDRRHDVRARGAQSSRAGSPRVRCGRPRSAGCWRACSWRSPRSSRSMSADDARDRARRRIYAQARARRHRCGAARSSRGAIAAAQMTAPVAALVALRDRDRGLAGCWRSRSSADCRGCRAGSGSACACWERPA